MTRAPQIESDLLTPAEVATMFKVDSRTVTRWANTGLLPYIRTLGGHRRFKKAEIHAIIEASTTHVRAGA